MMRGREWKVFVEDDESVFYYARADRTRVITLAFLNGRDITAELQESVHQLKNEPGEWHLNYFKSLIVLNFSTTCYIVRIIEGELKAA